MVIGITGSFGAGKTTIAEMFKRLGAKIIDCDRIVHSLIDRKMRLQLSKFVFNHKAYLNRLNRIIHPVVIKMIKEEIENLREKNNVIILDAPLLIETGLSRICNITICVKTNLNTQILRVTRRTNLSREDILKRIRCQLPLNKKLKRADFIIDNNKTLAQTKKQVEKIWEKIRR